MKKTKVRRAILFAALLVSPVLPPGPSLALPPELWVVNEGSKDISIIDDIHDTPATIEVVDLGGTGAASPYGIAFSTLQYYPGEFVFVSQGTYLRVIEFSTRTIAATCDVAAWIGASEIILKGMDAARPELFEDTTADVMVERSYLHVAANVRLNAADALSPWYIVLDQFLLTDPPGSCANAVVAAGPLASADSVPMDAMEVRVLGSPAGPHVQRAWYTYRELGIPQVLSAAQVVSGSTLIDPWEVFEEVRLPAQVGVDVPGSIHPGAPHTRELPLLPDVTTGELLNLDTGNRCGDGGYARAVSVTGPGLGSYTIWTAKLDAGGGTDLLQRSRWDMCGTDPGLPVGENPVDIETLGRVEWKEVYVANHDSDDISVIQEIDPGVVFTIPLDDDPGPCVKCPRSLAVRETPRTICRAIDHQMELINGKTEVFHTWNGIGCELQDTFKHWCKCYATDPLDCPAYCRPDVPKDGGRAGETWVEVDIIAGSGNAGGTTTTTNSGQGNTEEHIEQNEP